MSQSKSTFASMPSLKPAPQLTFTSTSKPACTDSAMFESKSMFAFIPSLKLSPKPPFTSTYKPACTDSAMFVSSAAKADSRLEDYKPVPKPFESLEDSKPASKPEFKRSLSSQLIHEGMEVKDPHELYNLVQSVHQNAGYKLSELCRTSKGTPFTSAEMKDQFGYESFKQGTKEFVCPRRGKFCCIYDGYCSFNVAFTFIKVKRAYVILNGAEIGKQQYYTNLCLHHNHDPYSTVLAGVTEVTSSKDLSEEEKYLLKHCALLGTRLPSVQHSLSTKFGKDVDDKLS